LLLLVFCAEEAPLLQWLQQKHSTAKAAPKERQQISLPKTTDEERGRDCIGISNPKAIRLTWRMPIGSL
jgi:hypothetical protein